MVTDALSRYRYELIHDGKRYLLAYGILAVEPFFMVPLLLALLRPEQIGALGAIDALTVVLCGFSQLGVKFSYLQHVADYGSEGRGRGFWSATLLTAVAGATVGWLTGHVLGFRWMAGLFGQAMDVSAITLGWLLLVTNLQMMLVTDLRAKRNPMPFVFSSVLRLAVTLGLVAFVVPGMSATINGVLLAQAGGMTASALLLAAIGKFPPLAGFDWKLARSFMAYGWPIATGSLVKYGTDALLPWLCLTLVSPTAAGAMTLAMRTASLFDTGFGLPFLMAWGGRIYAWLGDKASYAVLPALCRQIGLAASAAALLAWAAGAVLLGWHQEDTAAGQAYWLLPLALLGKALFILRSPASAGLLIGRDMRWNLGYAVKAFAAFGILGPVGFLAGGVAAGWCVFLMVEAAVVLSILQRGNAVLVSPRGAAG